MSTGKSRADRLREMERLYIQRAFTDIELAERLGVARSTVFKDRQLLEEEVPFIKDESGRWRIDRSRYLSAVRVNRHEALALYLAARRASRQTYPARAHMANALEKLAVALNNPMAEKLVHTADRVLSQNQETQAQMVMETVTQAWAERLKVRLVYRALNSRHAVEHTARPYLIEPAHWSDAVYLIAYSERMEKLVPFKIDRIERAGLDRETFEIPDTFDEEVLLRHAWGIWYAEQEPVEVVLRFRNGRATQRLRETIWHPLQKIEEQPNGDCVWRAPVDEWREMVPWIRGWGADCEVVGPQALRIELVREVQRLNKLYGLQTSQVDKDDPDYHRKRARNLFGGSGRD